MYDTRDTINEIVEPKISVIMSVYNGDKYVHKAIKSILNQTFTDFEFIIIDDGSTDGTFEIINSFVQTDDRIRFISRKNKGLVSSLNECLSLAKGQYIARMDADDISIKTRFAKQNQFLGKLYYNRLNCKYHPL